MSALPTPSRPAPGHGAQLKAVEAEPAPVARGGDDPPEVTAAFAAYRRTGDRSHRNRLVEQHRSIAEALARRYVSRGVPVEDLEQVAFVGLLKAVERFDPTTGVPFAGFAVPTVTGEIRRHFRDMTWAVHVHRHAKELHTRLPDVSNRLTGELGRPPTPAELAEALDCTIDEVVDALDAGTAYRPTSTDTHAESTAASFALNRTADPGPDPDERAMLQDLLAQLSERDRQIIGLRYFEDLTQSEIAAVLGVSQVHVGRLLQSAIDAMRTAARAV